MINCKILPTMWGERCTACGASWDRDETEKPCPNQVATRAHDENLERSNRYVSALAPDPFGR